MSVHQLPDLPESICKALLETIWAHDPPTARHCQRVGRMTAEFLTFLGATPEQIHHGQLGGMIHDVGKIGVPVDLLNKAGSLTPTERKRLIDHAVWGKQIIKSLRKMKGMKNIADIIEYHHEQWVGKGYPNHLKAEEIPYLARVASITDSYDAMTSKRSYGTPKTPSAAILEIQNCAGTQFDPELAAKFVEWMRHHRIPAPKRAAA
jgi:HD-GYP domain-containing protein (c-di-GMP phosphodiesterase class II)